MTPGTGTISSRAQKLFEEELNKFKERTPKSAALYERAERSMPFGVTSSFQAGDPYPVYIAGGKGSKVFDIDGNESVDYHNGFGTMAVGHAHPKVVAAMEEAARSGTHFAATGPEAVEVAEELKRRFGFDKVRFTNSGTEATMDAIRLARAATSREILLKIEGSYHGHHDDVMYSVVPTMDSSGPNERPWTVPFSRGIPEDTANTTKIVPFNDPEALEKTLIEFEGQVAAVIMEPVMMNLGIVKPLPGYLEQARDLCAKHGALLIFDEVKAGVTIAPGGATDYFGVQSDLVCLAKAIGGGAPVGAFGGRSEVMDEIENGVAALGTFNGNRLSMLAARATLCDVLDTAAYEHLKNLGTRLASGCLEVAERYGIPAVTTDMGCKGSITFRDKPIVHYRDFLEVDDSLFEAFWFYLLNRGVYMTPGKEEQWTISVQHSEDDIDLVVELFDSYCKTVTS